MANKIEEEYQKRKMDVIFINIIALFIIAAIIPTGVLEKLISVGVLAYVNYEVVEKELLG